MKAMPSYAPFGKKIHFSDEVLLTAEKHAICSTPDPITYQDGLSAHDIKGMLSNHLQIRDLSVIHQDQLGRVQGGEYAGFHSTNLTWIPGLQESKTEQFFFEQNTRRAYLFRPQSVWSWRDDIDVEPIKKFIDQLELEQLFLVRLIYLSPPAVGGVHVDVGASSMRRYYDDKNGISLTFNLCPGDGALHFYRNGEVFKIPPDISGWHFDPSVPHAVGKINQKRIQLRVFGTMAREKYLRLLNLEAAVW